MFIIEIDYFLFFINAHLRQIVFVILNKDKRLDKVIYDSLFWQICLKVKILP